MLFRGKAGINHAKLYVLFFYGCYVVNLQCFKKFHVGSYFAA